MNIRDYIADINPEFLLMDGFDDYIVGIASRFGSENFVIYDYYKVIAKNMSHGMTEEEAVEYFQFNQECAHMGEFTPGFLITIPNEITTDPAPSR
jgi:hypothetical protein